MREDVPAGTPAPVQEAFPQVTPQDFQDAIASFHAFVATLTEHDADADWGTSTESATGASPTTPAEPARATDGDALLALAGVALDTQRTDHPEIALGYVVSVLLQQAA